MPRTRKSTETVEQKIERWAAGSAARETGFGYSELIAAGWEPGQVPYVVSANENVERFFIDDTRYVVVAWTDNGDVSVY